jgi:hypothetical protein
MPFTFFFQPRRLSIRHSNAVGIDEINLHPGGYSVTSEKPHIASSCQRKCRQKRLLYSPLQTLCQHPSHRSQNVVISRLSRIRSSQTHQRQHFEGTLASESISTRRLRESIRHGTAPSSVWVEMLKRSSTYDHAPTERIPAVCS